MKREPPPATRLRTPRNPPPPACWVWVVIWMEAVIQESSPASEMTASLWSRANSRTGMVVPVMRWFMDALLIVREVYFGLAPHRGNLARALIQVSKELHGRGLRGCEPRL